MQLPPWYSTDPNGTDSVMSMTDHDRLVSLWCQSIYEESKAELERYEEISHIDRHINYLLGKQWADRRPSYKAAPVSNRIWTNLIQLVSYLTDIRQSFEVRSDNRLYDDQSKILNDIVRAWFTNEGVDLTMAMIIVHAALTIGYGRLTWNPELNNGEGEVELTPCGALDVIPIRPGHKLQQCYGVIYRTPKLLEWFRHKYPTKGSMVPVDREYSQYLHESSTASGQGLWGRAWQFLSPQYRRLFGKQGGEYKDSVLPMALYREFWLRDNQKNTSNRTVYVGNPAKEYGYTVPPGKSLYPRGRLIIMGGPVVLYDGPNPFWHGQFPFAGLRINQVPFQWPGVSEFRNQVPLQDTMNNILAGILDTVKRAVNPPLLAPDNSLGAQARKNFDANMPGAKIFYNPASVNVPQYAQPANLPSFVFQTMLYAQQELDAQSGFIDPGSLTRRGIIPAADTLEQLKEGQQTLVRLKTRYIEDFIKQIGQQFVPLVFQFYSLGRRIQMFGETGKTAADFDYNPGTMVPQGIQAEQHWRQFRFYVQGGSLLKSSRQPVEAKAMILRRQGDIDRNNLLDMLDMSDMKESIEKGLEKEGTEIIINMLRQKMSATGGGAGLTPDVLNQLNKRTTERPVQ